MDVFLEYLMRKRASGLDKLKELGLVIAGILLCIAILLFMPLVRFLAAYVPLAIAAVVYGVVILSRNFNLEYEYIFTNGDLDIDIVKAQKTRKRMTSIRCKNIELMASDSNMVYKRDFEGDNFSKEFDAVFDVRQGGIYHVIYTFDGERMLLSFQPPVKLLAAMKKMNPRCVFVDAEDAAAAEAAE